MRRLSLIVAGAIVSVLAPIAANATHGGCVVHPSQTTCSNKIVATTTATGYSAGPWEVTVVRADKKVVVGGGVGGSIVASPISATFGETYTLTMFNVAGQSSAVGVISVGNTAGHP